MGNPKKVFCKDCHYCNINDDWYQCFNFHGENFDYSCTFPYNSCEHGIKRKKNYKKKTIKQKGN